MTNDHQSDSTVQTRAEAAIIEALARQLGVDLEPGGTLRLSGGVSINLDARSADGTIAVEAYARQGTLKGAQLKKMAPGASAQASGEAVRPLEGGRRVVMHLVVAVGVEAAQPALVSAGPVLEVVDRVARPAGFFRPIAPHGVEVVRKALGQLRLAHRPGVALDEHGAEKAEHERRGVGAQQPPSGMELGQQLHLVEPHRTSPL